MQSILASILHRFLIEFSSQLRPLGTTTILIFHWFFNICLENRYSKLTSIFDPIRVPTWLHVGSQNRSKSDQKIDQKKHQNFDRFLGRSNLAPKTAQNPKNRPPRKGCCSGKRVRNTTFNFSTVLDRLGLDLGGVLASILGSRGRYLVNF